MSHLRKFYTLNRTCALRNSTMLLIRERKNFEKVKFLKAACCYNLSKKLDKFTYNLPVFNIYQCEINSSAVKCYCTSNTNESRKYLISTFEVRKHYYLLVDTIKIFFQKFFILFFVDGSFNSSEFFESAELAVRVVSKLISEKRLSELDALVTPECLEKLTENIDNWEESDRGNIAVRENDQIIIYPYNYGTIQDGNRKALEISIWVFIIKNFVTMLNQMRPEDLPNVAMNVKKLKTYGANYRFIKWVTEDGSSDWTVNGINHFKLESGFNSFEH